MALPQPPLLSTLLDHTGLASQIFVLGKSKHSRGDLAMEEPGSSHEASQRKQAGPGFLWGTKWPRALLGARNGCSGISSFVSRSPRSLAGSGT